MAPLPRLNALEVLCLDLDDTILDNRSSMKSAWRAVSDMLVGAYPDLDTETVMHQLGRSTRWFWSDPGRTQAGRLDLEMARRSIVTHVLENLGVTDDALAEESTLVYTEHRRRGLRLHRGVIDVLEGFRGRVPRLALVTNGATEVQREKIERFGLGRFFDHVQLEGEFGAGKPDPSVYENVMRVLDAEPGCCLMVGDDYAADVLGALAVGMAAAWIDVAGTGRTPAEPPRPHATVRSLAELAERLGV